MIHDGILAIDERAWAAMQPVIDAYTRGVVGWREAAAALGFGAARPPTRPVGEIGQAVAVIPLQGVLTPRGGGLLALLFGGTSLEQFAAQIRQAAADPSVSAIVIDSTSPGGNVYGVEEAADAVAQAARQKRVVSSANAVMASAAYWIGSAASEVVISPSGEIGSLGVMAKHEEVSKLQERLGIRLWPGPGRPTATRGSRSPRRRGRTCSAASTSTPR
jgi:ClpP class serine protease